MTQEIDPRDFYRLPWTLNDNILGWLEPTKRCNLYCEGCYSRHAPDSDKTLAQIRSDLEVFRRKRIVDSISIAGGDPLVHPDIVEVVRMVRHDFGYKPVINTNGLALTDELLRDLKRAGVAGFTFHVDSSQTRPGWPRDELELCRLRLDFAERVAAVGGLSVAFNATVFRHTLQHVPQLMDWARDHIDIVHSMVFILFRTSRARDFAYFAGGKPVDVEQLVYYGQDANPEPITAPEVVRVIRESQPEYAPCAYLGGTHDARSFKWLTALRLGSRGRVHGYLGPRYMEAVQSTHHFMFGRYLAYSHPSLLQHGRTMMSAASVFDPGARRTAYRYAKAALRQPSLLAQRVFLQSILIIQPIDFLADGSANMCDGCPDMTVYEGDLVWSCRLDERMEHGCFLNATPLDGKRRLSTVPPH